MNAKTLSVFAATAAIAGGASASPLPLSPWEYSVFGLSGVGSPSARLTGTVNGTVGSAGDVFIGSISANAGPSGYAVLAGGAFNMNGGSVAGNIAAFGDASITSATANGSLESGGTLYGSGGSISGPATAAGGNASTLSFGNGFQQASPVQARDGSDVASYYSGLNSAIAQRASSASYTNQWGKLSVSALSGLNIVDITSSALDSAWGFEIAGPADATVVLRVSGVGAQLDSINWMFSGGAQASKVLVNFFEAESLNLSGGHAVSFLAPNADVTFSGNLTGSLVGDTIAGGGSLTGREFVGDLSALQTVPTPAGGVVLLGCAAFVVGRRRRA